MSDDEKVVINGSAIEKIVELAQVRNGLVAGQTETPDGTRVPLALRHDGDGRLTQINLYEESLKWRDAPIRRKGEAKAESVQSFIDLVNRHKDDSSAIFSSTKPSASALLAVIDYHTIDCKPRFGQHRIRYVFPVSDEWAAWSGSAGQWMSQDAFAHWIENRIAEIASPEGGERGLEELMQTKFAEPTDMLRFSRGLSINVESRVKSVVNLQSGEAQLVFEEEHKDSDGKPLKIPGLFVVSIPLFNGGKTVRLSARLRYRKEAGAVKWAFDFYRWRDVWSATMDAEIARVAAETHLPIYEGSPEA